MSRRFQPATLRGLLAAGLLALAALAALAAGARRWVGYEERKAAESWRGLLSAMAEDRRAVIESWGGDRERDARRVADYPTTLLLAQGGPAARSLRVGTEDASARWTRILRAELDRYEGAWLVAADESASVLASTGGGLPDRSLARRAITLGSIQFEVRSTPRWQVLIAAPVRPGPAASPALGAVVLAAGDASHPLEALAREPLPTRTGESLLVRREQGEVVFLSPLRHARSPLRLASKPPLAAAAALEGREEFGSYLDYRGVAVLAAVRPIRGTDLGLVVKVDRSEALEPVRREVAARMALLVAVFAAVLGIAYGVWRDRHAAQIARELAERTLRTLYVVAEQSPVTIVVTDTSGTIEYVNPAFSVHSGYSREEAIGQNPRMLKSGHHTPAFYAEIYETLRAGREWRGEILNRRKDGELYWEQVSISPIVAEDGRVTHYAAVKENITQRKQSDEALRRAQDQLQQVQRLESVGRLAGGVAHDFNNLMGVIIGHCERARSAGAGRSLEPRLEQILAAAQRAAELTRQLLAFSRRQVLQPLVLSLNDEIAEMEKMLRRLIGDDVQLVVRLASDLGRVRADPSQIGQVLMNLAANARDAMPRGGTLTIETRNVELDERFASAHPPLAPGRFVELRVADDGVGMEESVRSHVFEPFFTTKADGQGFGLGLATVYGVVKQSGGYVWVESSPGCGTTFTIHLPLVDAPAAVSAPEPQPLVEGGHETALVVEDQDGLRDLIAEMLEEAGYRVLSARDGERALALSASHAEPIDLLVTDVVMPGINGVELARRLRSFRPQLRVLLMSGYARGVVGATAEGDLGPAVLEKPFTRAALLQRVREALAAPARDDVDAPHDGPVAP